MKVRRNNTKLINKTIFISLGVDLRISKVGVDIRASNQNIPESSKDAFSAGKAEPADRGNTFNVQLVKK